MRDQCEGTEVDFEKLVKLLNLNHVWFIIANSYGIGFEVYQNLKPMNKIK